MKMKRPKVKNPALLFTSLSVAGTIGAAALGVWVGVRMERARVAHQGENLSKTDWFKLMWKEYVGLTLSVIFAGGCAIVSHRISARDIAKLATLATGGGAAFSKYRQKVRELLGEEKEKELYKEVQTKQDWTVYPQLPHSDDEQYNDLSYRYRLEFDGTEFYSNPERVGAACYHLNRQFILNNTVSLRDFKNYIGYEEFDPKDEDYIWVDVFFYNNEMMPWIDVKESYDEENGEVVHVLFFEWNPMTEAQLEELDCL